MKQVEAARVVANLEQHGTEDSGGQEIVKAMVSGEGFPGFPLLLGPNQPE